MAENLAHLISTSLGFGVVIALLLLLRRVLDGRFAPTWWRQVWTWLLVVMFLYLPAQSFLTAVIPSLIEVDTPQAPELQDPVKGGSELPYEDHERVRASIVLEESATLMQGYRGAVPKHV